MPLSMKRALEALEKERQVLDLLRLGYSFEEIAERVGYKSRQAAANAAWRALRRLRDVNQFLAEFLIEEKREELAKIKRALTPGVEAGRPRAAEVYLKAVEMEMKLLGLTERPPVDLGQVLVEVLERLKHVRVEVEGPAD